MPSLPFLATPLLAALLLAGAAPAHADELADLVNAYRAAPEGCNRTAPLPPLKVEAALAHVQLATGTFLEAALRQLGYRAERAEAILVNGPQDAQSAMAVLRQKYCTRLLDDGFSAIGTARSGNRWQVLLARPVIIPDLPAWQDAGQQILALANAARAVPRRCGGQAFAAAAPLRWNPLLGQAALAHSEDMAARHYFDHQQPDGSFPADRATRAGYAWRVVGENIASGQRTPQEAVAAWLDSPGHCANLMNPKFSEMGAAWAINPANDNRTAYWTQMFGAPR
jgi:uncharacterized protein YkwD